MKKLFAFDMDGTVLNAKEEILPGTLKAIIKAKELGHTTVLATGRPIFDITPVTDKLDKIFDYFICNNGTYIYDVAKDEYHYFGEVSVADTTKIIEESKKHNAFYAIHTATEVFRGPLFPHDKKPSWVSGAVKEEWNKWIHTFTDIDVAMKDLESRKIMQVALRLDKEGATNLYKATSSLDIDVDIRIANEIYVDHNPVGINKYFGLKKLLGMVDIDEKNVIVFGDSGNDVDMLKNIKHSFAMGNGSADAKEVASETIGDHNEESIGEIVERFL